MNPLASLKEKLRVKPNIEDRERVAIVIKGIKTPIAVPKKKVENAEKDTELKNKSEIVKEKEDNEDNDEPEEKSKDQRAITKPQPIIVDETQKGFDRDNLMQKLKENKKLKVVTKPIIQITQEKLISQPTPLPVTQKGVKKLDMKMPLIIEEDENEQEDNIAAEKELHNEVINEEDEEEFVMSPKKKMKFEKEKESMEIIPIQAVQKKKRITKKLEKGVAILGPETLVEIGDTDLRSRMPKKLPPVLIKVSSYYMNNREIFVNFINSLFEPYRKELTENKENISCDIIGKTSTDFALLTHQKIVRDYMNLYTPYRGLLLYHGLGSGKCHAKNTPIMMCDGTIKLVQDIKAGEFLMGDDSTPRRVMSLARGRDRMYEIISANGDKYTVNEEHVLCLKASGFPKISKKTHNSNTSKPKHDKTCKTQTKYNIRWIENNTFQSKTFTYNVSSEDQEIAEREAHNFFENIKNDKATCGNIIEIAVKDYLNLPKKLKSCLKGYKVPIDFPEKPLPRDPYTVGYMEEMVHIPNIYKCNSSENRLQLLAGIVDRHGKLNKRGVTLTMKNGNEAFMEDVIYLSRSLGFSCYKKTNNTDKNKSTQKIVILGNGLEEIPTQILSKQVAYKKHPGNALEETITVSYVNEDEYYGFMIDKNCRYVMGDFTVTHNTATSIAIAEGMKDSKRVIIMTPASLRANYIEELKKAGDLLYKRNQFWEWITIDNNTEALETISALLNLPREYIRKYNGAFFINVKKPSNYDDLNDTDKKVLEDQLNEMIKQKYTFINYNGLRSQRLSEMTSGFTRNIFDNAVVIIDEAHNLISRIVNKLKKEKPISGEEKKKKKEEGAEKDKEKVESLFGENIPLNLATKLYYMLLRANNARIVLLSGTPVINYPNEFAILFNILRGYIKTWKIPLVIKTKNKIDRQTLQEMLLGEKSLDYLDYSPSSKILTITRNPFGFKNKIKKDSGYQGVANVKKNDTGETVMDTEFTSDEDFERKIINILKRNEIDIVPQGVEVINQKALPDDLNTFLTRYINDSDKKLKNVDALKRRIIGLSSYFKSAQESLLPKYNKQLGVDYNIVRIPMSDTQFKIYEGARKQERELETSKKKPSSYSEVGELFEEKSSTYRIFSRLFCNFIMPDRPIPGPKKKKNEDKDAAAEADAVDANVEVPEMAQIIKEGLRTESRQDVQDEREGEIEGDEILDAIGGIDYKERLDRAIKNIEEHANDFLTLEALQTYSPKFLHMIENIQDEEHQGLHLVYSQFRTAEGIGLFSLALEKNGFARFNIKKNSLGVWEIDIPETAQGKPTYALYTGTETSEEKEIIRHIYNGEWDDVPDSIGNVLKSKYHNNNMGEVIKVFMITSSGSEGINLRNTRFVHIMEPYWHPVRLEQVIGRARRICSHKDLPKALQTVEVFVYLMIFSESQLKSDEAIELKRKDLSKALPRVPITSDQYLYEISEIKANLTAQLTDAVKETAFDCYIYSNGKCVNFGDPRNDKFSYVPDYSEQQNDTTVKANKVAIEWVGKPITINGIEYVYKRASKDVLDLYDKEIYKSALVDPSIIPLKVGTYEIDQNGNKVLKLLVT